MKLKHVLFSLFLAFAASTALGQASLTVSAISGHEGVYSPGDNVAFTFTLTNTTPEAGEGDADPGPTNDANTAKNIVLSGTFAGTDFYGNRITIDLTSLPSVGNIGPGSSQEVEASVTIPRGDGTLHNTSSSAYGVNITVDFESGDPVAPMPPLSVRSTPAIQVEVIPNLILEDVAYLPGTYEGGDLIQITAFVRNAPPPGSTSSVRPLDGDDDFRTSLFLSEDPSIDSGNDFLLGFFGAFGSSVGAVFGSVPTGDTTVRIVRTDSTPPKLAPYDGGRDYTPQPDDGFLDIGEMIIVTLEVLVPNNTPGAFFVGGFTDSLGELPEQQEGVDASFGSQGDNIFVQELTPQIEIRSNDSANTEPVSEVTDVDGAQITQSNGVSDNPSVSEDGVWIAFESLATNLDPDLSGNGNRQIYLRNRDTREITLISVSPDGTPGNRDSRNPAISADGRFVAFESTATNLMAGLQGAASQIYVYDREERLIKRISVSSASIPGNGGSFAPAISETGRFIAFESSSSNLDPEFQAAISGTAPLNRIFVHDRDVSASGLFDDTGNIGTRLASVTEDGTLPNAPSTQAAIAMDGSVVAFVSRASNLDSSFTGGPLQVWTRFMDPTTGLFSGEPELVSLNDAGDPANADSADPAINGGVSTPTYGLQIGYSSRGDNLVPNDTNDVADIFVRDYSDPLNPLTKRVSLSSPRAATGWIVFFDPAPIVGNVPDSQPAAGDEITLDDGTHSAVTFRFVNGAATAPDVEIGGSVQQTRDNLVAAIETLRAAGDLNIAAYASSPPSSTFGPGSGFFPGLTLISTDPGEAGNQPILVTSAKIIASGMEGGGTEAFDLVNSDPDDPFSEAQGNLQPSLDRSGRLVAFRSISRNLDIVRDATRFKRNPAQPNADVPGVGVLIRPLFRALSSNVYFRDRDVARSGVLDDGPNTDTVRASVNRFGYPTNRLLNIASSGSNRAPSFSANGRIIAFASDSENNAGLRFGRTNTNPLDTNGFRDVFLFDRLVVEDIGGGEIVPRITRQPTDQDRIPGRNVAFVVQAVGVGPLEFQWQKDGVSLSNTSRISGANTTVLTLENLQPNDSGLYRVIVQNEFGTVISRSAVLDVDPSNDPDIVNEAPVIISQPADLNVGTGNPAIFSVTATGIPAPTFQWRKNGTFIADGPNVNGTQTSQLEILAASASDAGAYSVVVTNSEGSAISQDAILAIGGAPQILSQPAGGEFAEGSQVVLQVTATGSSSLSYQWFKDGFLIQGANASSHVIESFQPIDAGSYVVEVTAGSGAKVTSDPATVALPGGGSGSGAGGTPNAGDLALGIGLGSFSVTPEGWILSPAFGFLFLADDPGSPGAWAFSPQHGWLFMVADGVSASGRAFWVHDTAIGWFWTAEGLASSENGAFFFSPNNGGWLFYAPGSTNPRWFFNYSTGTWTNL